MTTLYNVSQTSCYPYSDDGACGGCLNVKFLKNEQETVKYCLLLMKQAEIDFGNNNKPLFMSSIIMSKINNTFDDLKLLFQEFDVYSFIQKGTDYSNPGIAFEIEITKIYMNDLGEIETESIFKFDQ